MTCKSCGSTAGGDRFCLSCGAAVVKENNQTPNQEVMPNETATTDPFSQETKTQADTSQGQSNPWGTSNQNYPWNTSSQSSQWGTTPPAASGQRKGVGAGGILGIIAIALTGISWVMPLMVDLVFSIPAILIGIVGTILGGIFLKNKGPAGLIISPIATGFAIFSTIMFFVLLSL